MTPSLSRRDFCKAGAGTMLGGLALPAARAGDDAPALPMGKAEHCIFLWLGGGACQIDTWDPKRRGDPEAKQAGSYYDPIPTAVPGVEVCEHLARCADRLDRMTIVRTVHHDVIDEHAAAVVRLHTGRPTTGTVIYPSIGSIVAHARGPADDRVPSYMVLGYPNVARGPGFLGSKAGYVYLTDLGEGPKGLSRPEMVDATRYERRQQMLDAFRRLGADRTAADAAIAEYDATISEMIRLSGPDFARIFRLDEEPADLRASYGEAFGQRCLQARRLVEAGVRFVEVSHNLNFANGTGWDTHQTGQLKQHLLIQELDAALAALVDDLESRGLLDRTLIVVGTEFGRPAQFDFAGGRGHHGAAFSVVLAGGGLRNGRAVGLTDELGMEIVEHPVSVPDLHATIFQAMGISPSARLYAGERPVPVTDGGRPIAALFG